MRIKILLFFYTNLRLYLCYLNFNNLAFQSMQNLFFSELYCNSIRFQNIAMEIRLKSVSGKPFHKVNVN